MPPTPEVGREGIGEVGLTWNNSDVRNNETSAGIAEKKAICALEERLRNTRTPAGFGPKLFKTEASKTAERDLRNSVKEIRSSR